MTIYKKKSPLWNLLYFLFFPVFIIILLYQISQLLVMTVIGIVRYLVLTATGRET